MIRFHFMSAFIVPALATAPAMLAQNAPVQNGQNRVRVFAVHSDHARTAF